MNLGVVAIDDTQVPDYLYPLESNQCIDEVNKFDQDNALTIQQESRNVSRLNGGEFMGTSNERYFVNYYPNWIKSSMSHHPGALSSIPSVGTVATAVLARSNPSKPYVSVPNFLYELKDLPGMIRDIGRLRLQARNLGSAGLQGIHPKVAANHYLAYQMGWKPLISDLRRLLDFQAKVDKKLHELENLYNKGGLQRRVRSPEWEAQSGSRTRQSSTAIISISAEEQVLTKVERWGTVRWYPANRPDSRYSSKELAALARRLTFGLNGISAKQVWDAIPWTWLIGWFSNVDEFLQAHSNTIPLVHSTPCIMTKQSTTFDWSRRDVKFHITGGEGRGFYTTKSRVISSGSLSATIPFLNGRQLSILSALIIQRKR
ncbi:MAG: putative maturation protein [Alehxovirus fundenecus]|uniref:Maturation protein n=1 Tax=Leviviridae sp. TaxID=2027243 RepID=A0ABY3SV40_9VIRU|nr:MAG: putative maturation protein [Leviviridae sp.]